MTPRELFRRHPMIALDSNVLIYLFEGAGPLADAAPINPQPPDRRPRCGDGHRCGMGSQRGRDLGGAIHVATAKKAGATCFVTNDARIRGRAGVEVVRLADIAVTGPRTPAEPGAR